MRKRDFCFYRVGRKRRRTQSLRADEIMRSPLCALNALAFSLFPNINTLNLLNSVVQNYFRNLS